MVLQELDTGHWGNVLSLVDYVIFLTIYLVVHAEK